MTANTPGRGVPITAAVVCSGTEFFLPYADPRDQPVDHNGPMITNELARRGVLVIDQGITRDDIRLQVARLQQALASGANMIVTNAGTGSSADDTMWQVISEITGRPLVSHPALRRLVMGRQRALGDDAGDAGLIAAVAKQSALPDGAVWLPPPGTAPPFFITVDGTMFVSTPGPSVEARPALMAVLEHDEVQVWLAAAAQLRLVTARFWGDAEVAINEALDDADKQVLTQGLPRATTCVTHGGAESVVQMQIEPGQEDRSAAVFSFLQDRLGSRLFSTSDTLDQLVGGALAGRSVGIYGVGPAATEVYLRLWSRTPVGTRLFDSDATHARFAMQGHARRRRRVPQLEGEQLAQEIAQRGLSRDRYDFAIAVVGKAPTRVCVIGAAGQRLTGTLISPTDRLTGVSEADLVEARSAFQAHEMLRMLYVVARQ
jgi:molybdopterin-biosynthesis enzyme MoeA-like protein